MSPRLRHDAANDPRFQPFPLHRARPRVGPTTDAGPAAPLPAIHYLIASTNDELAAARALVQDCYGRRGYDAAQGTLPTGETTLLARIGDRVIGTLTVRCGTRVRLQAEAGFAEHVGALRRQGRRLVEYTRFAIDRDWSGRHDLAAELIRRALLLGRVALGATDCVIEVNPRHMRYYQRQFGFTVQGPERTCSRVGAPARLLHLDMAVPPTCIAHDHGPRLH